MVTIERHNTESFESWVAHYESVIRRCKALQKNLPEMPDAAGSSIAHGGEWAALASLRDNAGAEICEAERFGAQGAAAAFTSVRYREGEISVKLGDREVTFPAIGAASTSHLGAWLLGFGMAAACRDHMALEILCRDDSVFAARQSSTQEDRFWLLLALALASLVKGDAKEWRSRAFEARLEMEPRSLHIADPGFVAATKLPLLDLGDCVMGQSQTSWDDAVSTALKAHRSYWGSEDKRRDWYGFLAFEILGLCSVAQDRGITTTVESPYLPPALVQGKCVGAPSQVSYHFPVSIARSVNEAHLFMSLRGCADAGRQHQIISKADRLVARYECQRIGGGEKLIFEFELPPVEAPYVSSEYAIGGEQPSALIDPGEFLLLAEELSKSVPASAQGLTEAEKARARSTLEEAIALLDEVLKFIPAGDDRVTESAFRTPRSRAARDAEPGRFERRRLQAVRDAWQELAATFAPASPPSREDAAKMNSLAAIQILAAQVTPLLEALRGPSKMQIIQAIKPRPDDYAKVFSPEPAPALQAAYEELWRQGIEILPGSDQTALLVSIAPAGMLGYDNELSRKFPGGYRAIAHLLNPHFIWVCWKYVRPGERSGMAFDGLVWVDDHWAWFPKPYRLLDPGSVTAAGS